jgi:uncharacterized protein YndB with AHSA1/START domain
MFPNNFAPEVGRIVRFQVDAQGPLTGVMEGKVLAADRPHKLSYTWVTHTKKEQMPPDSPRAPIVTWTIESVDDGSRLTLEHTGIEVMPLIFQLMLRMGWGGMTKRLIPKVLARVREQDGRWVFEPGAIPLQKRCYKVKTIPSELVR